MNKQEKAHQTATWLRKLADRYDQISRGDIKTNNEKAAIEIRMLVKLIKRALSEDLV